MLLDLYIFGGFFFNQPLIYADIWRIWLKLSNWTASKIEYHTYTHHTPISKHKYLCINGFFLSLYAPHDWDKPVLLARWPRTSSCRSHKNGNKRFEITHRIFFYANAVFSSSFVSGLFPHHHHSAELVWICVRACVYVSVYGANRNNNKYSNKTAFVFFNYNNKIIMEKYNLVKWH